MGNRGAGGCHTAGPGCPLPITQGSFGESFGVRPSPGCCFLPATRKKLFELARAFSEKTKMRKSKRKHLLKHQVYPNRAGELWGERELSSVLPRTPRGWPEPLMAGLWAGEGSGGTAATSQPHNWFP